MIRSRKKNKIWMPNDKRYVLITDHGYQGNKFWLFCVLFGKMKGVFVYVCVYILLERVKEMRKAGRKRAKSKDRFLCYICCIFALKIVLVKATSSVSNYMYLYEKSRWLGKKVINHSAEILQHIHTHTDKQKISHSFLTFVSQIFWLSRHYFTYKCT